MLSDFFRINLPYGIVRNDNGEWACFNREYRPLGYNTTFGYPSINDHDAYAGMPLFTKYKGLTESKLEKLANAPDSVRRDESGKINKVFFYNDRTNPQSSPEHWEEYFDKIKLLSKFDVAKSASAF